MQSEKPKHECKVEFDGFDWRNVATIESPKTGRRIRVSSNGQWQKMSSEVSEMFIYLERAWKQATFGTGTQKTTYALTTDAMRELLALAN